MPRPGGARLDLGEGDRAAGLALTIQIVANRQRAVERREDESGCAEGRGRTRGFGQKQRLPESGDPVATALPRGDSASARGAALLKGPWDGVELTVNPL